VAFGFVAQRSTDRWMSQHTLNLFKRSPAVQKAPSVTELKKSIRALAAPTSNGVTASATVQEEMAKLVLLLEKQNKEKKLTKTQMLDGNWRLLYTTNGGSSAGKLGPFVGVVDQDINLADGKYVNYVRLGGAIVEGALTASWDNLNDKTWRVKFEGIVLKVLGIPLVKKPLDATGIWRFTYVDADFRILYAQGGKNTVKENIYILAK